MKKNNGRKAEGYEEIIFEVLETREFHDIFHSLCNTL